MVPHILLVEDSALVIGALRLLLEETGHRVSDASTIAGAARVLRDDPPDVVLLDLTLGGEDGLSLMTSIDAEESPRPVVVALTGHDDPDTLARAPARDCRAVLVKPIRPLMLKSQIAGWLERARVGLDACAQRVRSERLEPAREHREVVRDEQQPHRDEEHPTDAIHPLHRSAVAREHREKAVDGERGDDEWNRESGRIGREEPQSPMQVRGAGGVDEDRAEDGPMHGVHPAPNARPTSTVPR